MARTMSSILPKIDPTKVEGHYDGYRILEKDGSFIPQRRLLFVWKNIVYSGGLPCGSMVIEFDTFITFENAKHVIDSRIRNLKKSTNEKIHYL